VCWIPGYVEGLNFLAHLNLLRKLKNRPGGGLFNNLEIVGYASAQNKPPREVSVNQY
jgi:hypothetical protein